MNLELDDVVSVFTNHSDSDVILQSCTLQYTETIKRHSHASLLVFPTSAATSNTINRLPNNLPNHPW